MSLYQVMKIQENSILLEIIDELIEKYKHQKRYYANTDGSFYDDNSGNSISVEFLDSQIKPMMSLYFLCNEKEHILYRLNGIMIEFESYCLDLKRLGSKIENFKKEACKISLCELFDKIVLDFEKVGKRKGIL